MYRIRKNGSTSNIERARLLQDGTGSNPGYGMTGLSSSSSGLIISTIADNEATPTVYTQAGGTIESITTLGTFAAPTATKCRFKEIDSTNNKGDYEFQFADARYAVSGAKSLRVTVTGVTGMLPKSFVIQLTTGGDVGVDTTHVGGTAQTPRDIGGAVPAAAAGASGGLVINGVNSGTVQFAALVVAGTTTFTGTVSAAAITTSGTVTFNALTVTNGFTTGTVTFGNTTMNKLTVTTDLVVNSHTQGASGGLALVGSQMDLVSAPNTTALDAIASDVWTSATSGGVFSYSVQLDAAQPNYAPVVVGDLGGVWDVTLASHLTSGSTGEALNAAGAAGDPWTTALPGAYGAGSAGYIIGHNIDALISSRMATYTQPTGFLSATFPTGTVASTTNITAGTITTVSGNVNGNVGGDVEGSVQGAVTSVVGDIGGKVLGGGSSVITGTGVQAVLADSSLTTAKLGTFALAKGTNITGFNDIAATAVVSGGAITTSGGAVSTVTDLTNAPTNGDFTATMKMSLNSSTPTISTAQLARFFTQDSGTTYASAVAGSVVKEIADNASGGGGGGGLTAQQTADAVFNLAPSTSPPAAGSLGDLVGSGAIVFNGARAVTITVQDDAGTPNPLAGALVRIKLGVQEQLQQTNSSGVAETSAGNQPALDDGLYTLIVTKGFDYEGQTVTFDVGGADAYAKTVTLPAQSIPVPGVGQCTGTVLTTDSQGNPQASVDFVIRCIKAPSGAAGASADGGLTAYTSGLDGTKVLLFLSGGWTYGIRRGDGTEQTFVTPPNDGDTFSIRSSAGSP